MELLFDEQHHQPVPLLDVRLRAAHHQLHLMEVTTSPSALTLISSTFAISFNFSFFTFVFFWSTFVFPHRPVQRVAAMQAGRKEPQRDQWQAEGREGGPGESWGTWTTGGAVMVWLMVPPGHGGGGGALPVLPRPAQPDPAQARQVRLAVHVRTSRSLIKPLS